MSHQKAMSKVWIIVSCSKYYKNDFCRGFVYLFSCKYFLQDRNKVDEDKKKFKSDTIGNGISLITFSVILNKS